MSSRISRDPEPVTISLSTVAEELRRLGRPRMAALVADCDLHESALIAECRRWRAMYEELRGPVEYTPPEPLHNPKPPPEASD
jgi:hypothetical protein